MPATSGSPMEMGEKTRFYQAIYAKNSADDVLTTDDIIVDCEKAAKLLSDEFVAMAKTSPFYFDNQQEW